MSPSVRERYGLGVDPVVLNRGDRPVRAATQLLGRDEDVAALHAVLKRRSGAVLVEGEPGIGKTRLLDAAADAAVQLGYQVLRAAAGQLEHDRPFGAIVDALGTPDILARLSVSQTPSWSSPAGAHARHAIVDEIVATIESRAMTAPVLVCLDDVHWADPSTLVATHAIVRRLRHADVVVAAACRPVPRPSELSVLADVVAARGTMLRPRPLSETEVGRLVEGAVGARPTGRLLDAVARAAGNPLFVTEVVASLDALGGIERRGDTADAHEVTLPTSLREAVLRRLVDLPASTLDVLRMASVLGGRFSAADLAVVLDARPSSLVASLDEALRYGVLVEAGAMLAFRHDLVRDAVYGSMPLGVRSALHTQAGRALAAAGATARVVATHFVRGTDLADAEAASYLYLAAREVVAHDPRAAAGLFRQAHDRIAASDPRRATVLTELVLATLWAGQLAQAEAQARTALADHTDPELRGVFHFVVAKAMVWSGRPLDSLEHLETASSEEGLSELTRAALAAELALRRAHCRRLAPAREAATQAVELGRRLGHVRTETEGLSALVLEACTRGAIAQSVDIARVATEAAGRDASGEASLSNPLLYLSHVLVRADRFQEARDTLRAARVTAEEHGAQWSMPVYEAQAATERFVTGHWDDAVAHAQTSVMLTDEGGQAAYEVAARAILALVAVHRGDEASASTQTGDISLILKRTGATRFGVELAALASALLLERRGEVASAYRAVSAAWLSAIEDDALGDAQTIAWDVTRLALASGDESGARAAATVAAKFADRAETSGAAATAAACRGAAERDPQLLTGASGTFAAIGRPYEAAASSEAAGVLLGSAGGIARLRAAADIYEQLGAHVDALRTEAALRGLGARGGARGSRKRAATGWDSLTRAQRAVADLAADGLTNRQIGERLYVSARTVETHLSNVFAKLGISTRAQLIIEAARREASRTEGQTSG